MDIEAYLRQQHQEAIKCFQKPSVVPGLKKLHFLKHITLGPCHYDL
jgi:hypothetical protein